MDRYFPVVKSTTGANKKIKTENRAASRYQPYPTSPRPQTKSEEELQIERDEPPPSSAALTKHLLRTLGETSNPITHSDIPARSDFIFSTSTGHQVTDGPRSRNRNPEAANPNPKPILQKPIKGESEEPQVLRGVCVYINGFLANTTDIEMKRIVLLAGGRVSAIPSGCTHILTSQQLSGSKTHKFLTTKSRNKVHVVKPEWVTDSIAAGRRRSEREYSAIKDATAKNLHDMMTRPRK